MRNVVVILLLGCSAAYCGAGSLSAHVFGAPRDLPPELMQRLDGMPVVGDFAADELVRYEVRGRQVRAELHLPADLARRLAAAPPQGVRLAVKGSVRHWTIRAVHDGRFARCGGIELAGYDPTGTESLQRVSVTVGAGVTVLEGGDLPHPLRAHPVHVLLVAGSGPMRLAWFLPQTQSQSHQDWVRDWTELESMQPMLAREYVEPMLRSLGAGQLLHRRPAADVYRMFPTIPANSAVLERVRALVEQLDAAAPAEREAATSALLALGRPGVLGLLRCEHGELSPEQRARVSKILAGDDWRAVRDIATARRDLRVLIDCLDDDDPSVRRAAKSAIELLNHRPLSFDCAASGWSRTAAVERMRDAADRTHRLAARLQAARAE